MTKQKIDPVWIILVILLAFLAIGCWVSDYTEAMKYEGWTADDYIEMEAFEQKQRELADAQKIREEAIHAAEQIELERVRETPEYQKAQDDLIQRYWIIGAVLLGFNIIWMGLNSVTRSMI